MFLFIKILGMKTILKNEEREKETLSKQIYEALSILLNTENFVILL